MGFLSKVSDTLFGSSGAKYNQDKSALTQVYGVKSDLGNMSVKKNADGTYSKVYESSDIDKQRNALALQGLGNINLDTYTPSVQDYSFGSLAQDPTSSYNPTQLYGNINQETADNAAQNYYDQATRLLNKNYQDTVDKMDERLINRGIQTGTEQYNKTMDTLADNYNATLGDIANQSVFQGQNLLNTMLTNQGKQTANEGAVFGNQGQLIANQGGQISNEGGILQNQARNLSNESINLSNAGQYYANQGQQINNVNGLTSGRDIYALNGMSGTNNSYDNAYAGQQYNDAMRSQRNNNIMNTISSGVGALAAGAMFSDKRLKENLKNVGKLNNGLKVYVGNYKKETGLDTRPQLFLLAQEVQKKHPEAVVNKMGSLAVDYKKATKKG